MIYGLSIIDILVILIYFAITIAIGMWSMKRIQNKEDYFLGGRKFGKFIQTFASFGQATSATSPVGVVTTTFRNGAAGIWSSLLLLFATPLFWITSPWLRRLRIMTMADFYEERYGSKSMAAVYALIGTIGMMALVSVGFTAMTKTVVAMTPKAVEQLTVEEFSEYSLGQELNELEKMDYQYLSDIDKERLAELRELQPQQIFSHIDENALVWIVCFIVLIYAIAGGLEAAFYTDMLQGNFIILLSVLLLPFGFYKISDMYGGEGISDAFTIMHDRLPQAFFEVFGSPTVIDFTWYYIFAIALVAGITVVTQPNQLVTNGAARDENSARYGYVIGTFTKRTLTLLWGLLGLASILLYGNSVQNSDLVWGMATRDLLGGLDLGLVGLMIASMMAALMSTADALLLTCSGLLVNNIYRPLFQDKSEQHFVKAGRIFGALFLIGGALITTQFDNILQILKLMWEFFVIFAAAFWLGLKWRRANKKSAWASIGFTFVIFYFIPILLPTLFPSMRTSEYLVKQTHPDPVTRTYTAHVMDVEERNQRILDWEKYAALGKEIGQKPAPLIENEEFEKEYILPPKSIFWSKDVKKSEAGVLTGFGYLYLELILLDKMGFQMDENPYALNETIRILIRLIFPFLILIAVALFTESDDSKRLENFYLKMRTRVKGDPGEDKQALEESRVHLNGRKETLVFPNSNWEIYKWSTSDLVGFLVAVGVVVLILFLFFFMVSFGA
ncbi:MAG: sodium:solute symporter family protein [Melioribacteraceae bacterium]|nr:sodium:solute symporter family protein [Melioribacteraceae bacterium]MCF8265789.1 sodium:solute symporter family protein [Melioribacteraceae bacterium]